MDKLQAFKLLKNVKYNRDKTVDRMKIHLVWLNFLFWTNQYDRAIYIINKIHDGDKKEYFYCWKGVIYYFLKDYNSAQVFLQKAESLAPTNLEIKYFLAETFYAKSQIEKAESKYRALTSSAEFKTIGLYGIGCCLFKAKRHDEALNFFNKAAVDAQKNVLINILNKKGLSLMILNRLNEARLCFEECLKLSPNDNTILSNLALVLCKIGDYLKASHIYKDMLNKMPYNIIIINNYASCLAACNKYDDALKYCNKGLNIDPINPDLLINKGYCLFKTQQYENALECLNEAENFVKDDIVLLNNKALCFVALKKYDDALNIFDNLIVLDKENLDSLMLNKAYCLIHKEKYNEALNYLTKIKDKNYKNHNYYTLKGICFEQLGNEESAVESFNKSLSIA